MRPGRSIRTPKGPGRRSTRSLFITSGAASSSLRSAQRLTTGIVFPRQVVTPARRSDVRGTGVIPKADVTVITSSSVINKSIERLLELSQGLTILIGPSTPMSPATKRAEERTVHILRGGYPLCMFVNAIPEEWPDNHFWVRIEKSEMDSTPKKNRCVDCWVCSSSKLVT